MTDDRRNSEQNKPLSTNDFVRCEYKGEVLYGRFVRWSKNGKAIVNIGMVDGGHFTRWYSRGAVRHVTEEDVEQMTGKIQQAMRQALKQPPFDVIEGGR